MFLKILISPKKERRQKLHYFFPKRKKDAQQKKSYKVLLRDSASFPMKSQNIDGFSAPEISKNTDVKWDGFRLGAFDRWMFLK